MVRMYRADSSGIDGNPDERFKQGREFEEGRAGMNSFSLKIKRDDPAKPPIEWTLKLPVLPIDWEADEHILKNQINRSYRVLPAALKEIVACFHPPKQSDWTDNEYKQLLSKIDSLLWAPLPDRSAGIREAFMEQVKPADIKALKFYPAIGTSADIHHKIDQFVVFKNDEGQKLLLTIDYGTSEKDRYATDLLITKQGAYLNPIVYPFAPKTEFVIPHLEKESSDTDARRDRLVAEAMAEAFEFKRLALKKDAGRKNDGHYDLYPLERTILINEKEQTNAGARLAGTSMLSRRHVEMLLKEDEEDDRRDAEKIKKGKQKKFYS